MAFIRDCAVIWLSFRELLVIKLAHSLVVIAAVGAVAVAACSPKESPSQSASASESAAEESAAVSMAASEVASQTVTGTFDAPSYMGIWTAANKDTLTITPNGTAYDITIKTSAGSRDFPATLSNGALSFTRDGNSYTLTKGDGTATGVDGLKGKHDCIIVAAGEGYCKG